MALSREQKIEKARELRAQNITCREIGERVGLSTNIVQSEVSDVEIPRECPGCGTDLTNTHAKRKWCSEVCRKSTLYGGKCAGCGAVTDGGGGSEAAPSHCRQCHKNRNAGRNELLREMWEADEPTWYIAQKLGMTETAVTAWVDTRRHEHGENLSLRRLGGNAKERERRHRKMIRLRRKGFSNAEIAEAVGMASADSVSVAFQVMRKKGWDVPPHPPARTGRREQVAP